MTRQRITNTLFILFLAVCLTACGQQDQPSEAEGESRSDEMAESQQVDREQASNAEASDTEASDPATGSDQVVDVVTREYAIDMPDTLKLGWNTFRFSNEGGQTHFVIIYRLAAGKTIEDQRAEVVPAFAAVMEGLRSGELTKDDIGSFLGENIPEWGLQMTYVGGAGLLAPGLETQSTFKLEEPGIHLVECYVKAPDGSWHTSMGMLKQVEVIDEAGNATEPEPDFEVSVGNDGVDAPETMPAGRHTIKVSMVDDPPTFMPFDLNLARMDDEVDMDELVFWMDWSNVGGLRAPAPVEFLGGVEHMNAGNHGYMTVDLEPGRYLWISEINAAESHQSFSVE